MKGDLLVEIGFEEIPSLYLDEAVSFLKKTLSELLGEARLVYEGVKIFSTPRRFVILLSKLSPFQQPKVEEITGPPAHLAFNPDGSLTEVAKGFIKKHGISSDALKVVKKGKGDYLVGVKTEKGKPVEKVLPEVLNRLISSIPFPKTMRWGKEIRFARPIRWLLVIYGEKPLKIDLGWIKSSDFTFGHRLLCPAKIRVNSVRNYFSIIKRSRIQLSDEERKKSILNKLEELEKENRWKIPVKEELLKKVVYSVEYPHPFVGRFQDKFLELPQEIIEHVLENYVRAFPVRDGRDLKTLPFFVGFSNTGVSGEIIKGYEKVVTARLEDAIFYKKEDLKKTIEEHVKNTEKIIYHEKLGSLRDKTGRMEKLLLFLGKELGSGIPDEILHKTARLSRFDHATRLGMEFPELCGTIGKWLGKFYGIEEEISKALYEQYLPSRTGDALPETQLGTLLAIADRIETISSLFYAGEKPTGSEDPFGLRRSAITLIELVRRKKIEVPIKKAVEEVLLTFTDTPSLLAEGIHEFITERFRFMLYNEGIPFEIIDAVLEAEESLLKAERKIRTLFEFSRKRSQDAELILTGYKRLQNILEEAGNVSLPPLPSETLFQKDEERELWRVSSDNGEMVKKWLKEENYTSLLEYFAKLSCTLDRFFKEVFVMCEDEGVKLNRLSLIKFVHTQYRGFANFYKIPTKKFTGGS